MTLRCLWAILSFYILNSVCIAANHDPNTTDWTFLTEKDGVNVWSREFSGSEVIAVRGITTLPYPVKEVFTVMSDNVRSAEWLPMVEEKLTVRQLDADSRVEYAKIKMPWPLQDRYTVAIGSLEIRKGNKYWISYKSTDGEFTDPIRIRARLEMSTFYLRPEKPNSTYLDVTLLSDPMGSVPKFLVNSFQKNWPVQFLTGLRAQIEKIRLEKANPPAIRSDNPIAH